MWMLSLVQVQLDAEDQLLRVSERLPINPDRVEQLYIDATGDTETAGYLKAKLILRQTNESKSSIPR